MVDGPGSPLVPFVEGKRVLDPYVELEQHSHWHTPRRNGTPKKITRIRTRLVQEDRRGRGAQAQRNV